MSRHLKNIFTCAVEVNEKNCWQRLFYTERGAINFGFRELEKSDEGQASVSNMHNDESFYIIKRAGRSAEFEGGDLEAAKFAAAAAA